MSHQETLIQEIRAQNLQAAKRAAKGATAAQLSLQVLPTPRGVLMRLLREEITTGVQLPMVQHAQARTAEDCARLLLQWVREFGWE